jgi:hypothetical protein
MSRTPTATSPSPLPARSFRNVLRSLLCCSCVCFSYAPYKRQHPRCTFTLADCTLCNRPGMANIPLHCNICPKKPNFSDVSHLLTHIASKGHLSNYYKVKVRSTNEESSRQLIEAYDQWYAEWSVEELMSERMNQKDKRRTRARPAGIAHNVRGLSHDNVTDFTALQLVPLRRPRSRLLCHAPFVVRPPVTFSIRVSQNSSIQL